MCIRKRKVTPPTVGSKEEEEEEATEETQNQGMQLPATAAPSSRHQVCQSQRRSQIGLIVPQDATTECGGEVWGGGGY